MKISHSRNLVAAAGIALVLAACAKERQASFPDGQGADVVEKSMVASAVVVVHTAPDASSARAEDGSSAIGEVRVDGAQGPEKLRSLFKDLKMRGRPNADYKVKFILSPKHATAVKVVADAKELSDQELQLTQLTGEASGEMMTPLFQVEIQSYGVLTRVKNDQGEPTANLRLDPADFDSATHLQMSTLAKDRAGIALPGSASSTLLPVVAMRDQEFLFRRTLKDSPNGFDNTFAGTSGSLEIVRFIFESGRVRVVRSKPIVDGTGNTSTDLETLIALPATYTRMDLRQDPMFTAVDQNSIGAIAIVDFSENKMPNVLSPLDYYGVEQCFTGARDQSVANVDARLARDGMLNLTLSTHYATNPSMDCSGLMAADYFDNPQANFTFKERISFKKYVKGNEAPLLDVPFSAQKQLGFGVFTYKKITPNDFGNTDHIGGETPLGAVFDVKQGRKLTYVLAGLPESGDERTAIIRATQEVIADWNLAFKKAFKGTPLEREGDVIELKIEGVDSDRREMGDLDRNYVYYVQKTTTSGVIGLGGAHNNPRSGAVEAASVFIYGGNIRSFVERLREQEAAKKAYEDIHHAALAGAARALPGEGGKNQRISESLGAPGAARGAISASQQAQLGQYVESLSGLPANPGFKVDKLAKTTVGDNANLFLAKALTRAIKSGALAQPKQMSTLISRELLDAYGSAMSPQAQSRLSAEVRRQESVAKIMGKFAQSNVCLFEADAEAEAGKLDLSEMTDLEVMVAVYKPTLAHELGHNFGLRHNFAGSVDAANFRDDAEKASGAKVKRTYSTIMDYLTDDHLTYDGLGPHDVAAIRAAYTGLIEVKPETATALRAAKIPVVGANLVSMPDYKKALGLKNWEDLSAAKIAQAPLKGYLFCSDEDAGNYPTCNRFDRGTTPQEIVANAIEQYKSMYALTNFAGDHLHFDWWRNGHYIGRLFSIFLPMRQMLEEGLHQAITTHNQEIYVPYLQAAFMARSFFEETIRTPDAPTIANDLERYVLLRDSDGNPIAIERKYLKDIALSDQTDRIAARGIEFDKVIALIMLSERRFGWNRYERESLRMSFPEFERMVLSDQVSDPSELPTMRLLAEVYTDRIRPGVSIDGDLSLLPGAFKVSSSEMMRFYGLVGAVASLDIDGLETTDNLSGYFRILSGFKAPAAPTISITRPGAGRLDPNELHFWAASTGKSIQPLIRETRGLERLAFAKAELVTLFNKWLMDVLVNGNSTDAAVKARIKAESAAVDARIAQIGLFAENGAQTMAKLGPAVMSVLSQAKNLQDAASGADPHELALNQELIANSVEAMGKQNVLAALFLNNLPEAVTQQFKTLEALAPTGETAQQSILFNTAQELNSVFLALHPEYAR